MSLLTILPPELLLAILAHLPLRPLLAFSRTSKAARALADSAMHSLALGLYPTRLSGVLSRLAAVTPLDLHSRPHFDALQDDARAAAVVIPDAASLDTAALLAFHNALLGTVVARYAHALRDLRITVWTMTPPVAKALASARGLRRLRLRVENPFGIRGGWRERGDHRRRLPPEPDGVWDGFVGGWHRLEVLIVEGSAMGAETFRGIVGGCGGLKELWLKNCPRVGGEVVGFLAGEWSGKHSLRGLGLANCGMVRDEDLEAVIHLTGLKLLSLYDCRGLDNDNIRKINKEIWKIPHLVLSGGTNAITDAQAIEVDPAYLSSTTTSTDSSSEDWD